MANKKKTENKKQKMNEKVPEIIYVSQREEKKKGKRENKKTNKKEKRMNLFPLFVLIIGFTIGVYFYINITEPSKVVRKYFSLLNEKKYDEMYDLVSTPYSREEFVNRIKNIYEGINASNISIAITSNSSQLKDNFLNNVNQEEKNVAQSSNNEENQNGEITEDNENEHGDYSGDKIETQNKISDIDSSENKTNEKILNKSAQENFQTKTRVSYNNSMNTIAGYITFKNAMNVINENGKYLIDWDSSTIFPELDENEKVRVKTNEYTRGTIFDRNNKIIAKDGEAYSIGLVKSKVDATTDLNKLSKLLNISVDDINKKLSQNYDSDNVFIELKNISKEEQDLKLELLKIKGVMITDVKARVYPYKEATSSITGYVQGNEGKTGIELLLNEKLKGENGKEIYIDKDGTNVKTIAKKNAKDGEDVKLTIDADEQEKIYDMFKDDKGCFVKINYKTGEILSLVSTPSYDANLFSIGISNEEWEKMKSSDSNVLYNRCLSTYAPGSTMKPLIGAIGLETNTFTADEDFGKSNLKWQKDSSWGNFYITTLENYSETANLQNALVYSDNIYFAKASLKIGKEKLKANLDKFGFNEKLDFDEELALSTYGKLDSDRIIANTGYGQGEVLVNPILMASIYSSFANDGTMCKPYLIYEENEENRTKIFKQNVISHQTANTIKLDLLEVVKRGTAKECYTDEKNLYGKTGTAEIKKSQDDKTGTENGWFDVFDDNGNLYISLCENVKNKGGSHYVVSKMKNII